MAIAAAIKIAFVNKFFVFILSYFFVFNIFYLSEILIIHKNNDKGRGSQSIHQVPFRGILILTMKNPSKGDVGS
jgi:hypothetical protein